MKELLDDARWILSMWLLLWPFCGEIGLWRKPSPCPRPDTPSSHVARIVFGLIFLKIHQSR